MSEFDSVSLFHILYESMGAWLWLLLAAALGLLVGIAASALRLRRAGRPTKRPLVAAMIVGLIVAFAATFAIPSWTLADVGALSSASDYAFAFLFALLPGAIVGAIVFIFVAGQCVARGSASLKAI